MKRAKKEEKVSQHAWMAKRGRVLRLYAMGVEQAEEVRRAAFDRRVTASAIVREAVAAFLSKGKGGKDE